MAARYKRYESCTTCPTLGLGERKIGWTGFDWVHVDTGFHFCIRPRVATPTI